MDITYESVKSQIDILNGEPLFHLHLHNKYINDRVAAWQKRTNQLASISIYFGARGRTQIYVTSLRLKHPHGFFVRDPETFLNII